MRHENDLAAQASKCSVDKYDAVRIAIQATMQGITNEAIITSLLVKALHSFGFFNVLW